MIFLHDVIYPLQQVLRQSGVEPNRFSKVGRNIEIDNRPNAASEVRIIQMHIDFLSLWQRITVGNQAFKVQREGFLCILQRFRYGCSSGEAASHIREGHAVIRVSVFVKHYWKFH